MPEIYLDNSASTRPYREVIELMGRVQEDCFGNPSSLHNKGVEAETLIEEARRRIAAFFDSREKQICFTSGGTEANNLAIKGAALRNRRRGNHLVTSAIEHPSVLNCFRFLEQQGFAVSYLPVNGWGFIDPDDLRRVIEKKTILVSIMHVNNEIGSIQPLEEIGPLIKTLNPATILHVDAVQSLTRLPLKVREWQADLVSCSAHKVHGPKGAGCLWIKDGTLLHPLLDGGGQERGLRPGTENTAAIAGFGLAARLSKIEGRDQPAVLDRLKAAFYREIQASGVDFKVNGPPPEKGAPHIINLSFPGLKAEMLLHCLEEQAVFVSAGSACHSRRPDPSHVLEALKLDQDCLESALRFSFSLFNTEQEAVEAARITAAAARELSSFMSG